MKRKNPIHAYKRLLAHDYDWSYAYLIALIVALMTLLYIRLMKRGDEA